MPCSEWLLGQQTSVLVLEVGKPRCGAGGLVLPGASFLSQLTDHYPCCLFAWLPSCRPLDVCLNEDAHQANVGPRSKEFMLARSPL